VIVTNDRVPGMRSCFANAVNKYSTPTVKTQNMFAKIQADGV